MSNDHNRLTERPDHGFGRSRGGLSTKTHALVDGQCLPLVTLIGPGHAGDNPQAVPLLEGIRVPRPVGRPRTVPDELRGDKAYSSREVRTWCRKRRVKVTIPEPADRVRNRKRKGSKGGRPPAFDEQSYKGRNVVERRFYEFKQWRGVATRYDKLSVVFRAGVMCKAHGHLAEAFIKHTLGDHPPCGDGLNVTVISRWGGTGVIDQPETSARPL